MLVIRPFASRLQSRMLCGFYEKKAGEARTSAQYTEDYSVVYIMEGGGIYEDDSHRIRFEAGWVVQRLPHRKHQIIYDTDTAMKNASIHLPFAAYQLMGQVGTRTMAIPTFGIGLRAELIPRYQEIIDELQWQPDERLFTTLSKMNALVTDLHALAGENQEKRSPKIQQACRYIEERVTTGITLSDVAGSVNMSVSHFRRVFREQTGTSPYQFLIQARINSAQRLLCTTDMAIGEIADILGFSNQFAFSKQFRTRCGVTPSDYRKQYKL